MNPAMLAMVPMISSNQVQPSNPSVPNMQTKFGAVLENALATDAKASLGQLEQLTEEQTIIEELLKFMKFDSLTDIEEGNTLVKEVVMAENENDALLTLLMKINGEDESVVAEFLASIVNGGLFVFGEDTKISLEEQELSLDGAATMQQEMQQLLSEIGSDLTTMLTTLNSLDVKDLSTVDLQVTVNVLKLAKLQDLVNVTKQVSPDEAVVQQEIKQLVESLTEKIEKSLSNPSPKSGNEASLATLLEKGPHKSLDIVRQAYAESFTTDKESDDETVSNGLTLKTAESNTQSSLPFQMTKLEQYVLTASKNGQPVDVEQFVKEFEKIVSKANFSNVQGTQKLLIRLNPDNLGSLRIELIQKDGAMIAKILTTTAQAKELLDRQVQGLKHVFASQNIQVEKIEVAQQLSTFNAERFAPRDQGQHEQQQQQTKQNVNEDEETEFTDRFVEALLNVEV